MKSGTSSGKIVIKPRLSTKPTASSSTKKTNLPAPEPDLDETEEEAVADGAEIEQEEDDGMDEDATDDEAADEAEDEGDGGEIDGERSAETPVRGRGRGGRGRVVTRGAPRGRPRGVGRGRGRGRNLRGVTGTGGLTIRLPRLSADDAQADGDGTEGGGDDGTPAPVEEVAVEVEKEKEKEKEEPLGGGKPFRKIRGKVHIIENDEFVTEENAKGNTKIDGQGNLLGGRRFKAATFTLPNRHPERVYMLAIDAARTSGFRDSLYYFRRNLLAFKLNATQPEKDYLIEQGKLGSHLRTRSVTLITARSAFKLHGSKMVVDGRWVDDDYDEEKVLAEVAERGAKAGDLVGDLSEPQVVSNEAAALGSTQAKTDRSGGSGLGMYRAGGPTTIFGGSGWGPYSDGPLNAVRKSLLNRDGLNEENWMFIASQRTADSGAEWAKTRREGLALGGIKGRESGEPEGTSLKREGEEGLAREGKRKKVRMEEDDLPLGAYEPHSGNIFYRADTQPTRSRWETLPDSAEKRQVLGGTKTGNGAWALAWVDTVMELPDNEVRDSMTTERRPLMSLVETT